MNIMNIQAEKLELIKMLLNTKKPSILASILIAALNNPLLFTDPTGYDELRSVYNVSCIKLILKWNRSRPAHRPPYRVLKSPVC